MKRIYSPIAQLVERWTVNPCVTGSSPVWGATLNFINKQKLKKFIPQ